MYHKTVLPYANHAMHFFLAFALAKPSITSSKSSDLVRSLSIAMRESALSRFCLILVLNWFLILNSTD